MPAIVVPAIVIAGAVVVPSAVGDNANLPDRTPAQGLALAAGAKVTQLTGTVEQSSNLGLPSLGAMAAAGDASGAATMLELLTASHTAKVYLDEGTGARVQVLDPLAERDLVLSGSDLWYYNSARNEATHVTGPAGEAPKAPADPATITPQAMAAQFLAAADESTNVTLGRARTVAGRAAYELILTPKTDQTLVGSVSIWVDAETGMPLGVDVRARSQADPAIHVAYTSLDLSRPDPAVFEFTPPPGTEVDQKAMPGPTAGKPGNKPTADELKGAQPKVIGSGWSAVAVLPAAAGTAPTVRAGESEQADAMLEQLTTKVAGGRALTTSLASVLLADDGRVLIGLVPVGTLQAAAAS